MWLLAACSRTRVKSSLDRRRTFFFFFLSLDVETVTADRVPPSPPSPPHSPKGPTDRTKPACRIFVGRLRREAATTRSDGADRARRTLDLAVVIGHGLFDWNKVITCYLLRRCPPPPAEALRLTFQTWSRSASIHLGRPNHFLSVLVSS